MYNNGGTLSMTDCTISGNTSTSGGGGLGGHNGTLTLTNCTVSGNTRRSADGGGLDITGGNGSLTNVTVSGNYLARQPTAAAWPSPMPGSR